MLVAVAVLGWQQRRFRRALGTLQRRDDGLFQSDSASAGLPAVAGVLRPRDIATDNSVSYDKIAEARISYGGRGRMTEVQQPAWGHQIIDLFAPF